jgi:hypothetical protein
MINRKLVAEDIRTQAQLADRLSDSNHVIILITRSEFNGSGVARRSTPIKI